MKNIAIFASGTGSNFDAIMKYDNNFKVKVLVSNKKNALVIQKAKSYNITVLLVNYKKYKTKEECENFIVSNLKELSIDYIVLAGYMKILTNYIISNYINKIINIHPSLLPSFKGKDAIKQAYDYGVKITGVSVHYVDEGVDTGKIIAQEAINIDGLNLEDITKKIHEVEHALYPKILQEVCK